MYSPSWLHREFGMETNPNTLGHICRAHSPLGPVKGTRLFLLPRNPGEVIGIETLYKAGRVNKLPAHPEAPVNEGALTPTFTHAAREALHGSRKPPRRFPSFANNAFHKWTLPALMPHLSDRNPTIITRPAQSPRFENL